MASLKDLNTADKQRITGLIQELVVAKETRQASLDALQKERLTHERELNVRLERERAVLLERKLLQEELIACQSLLAVYQGKLLELNQASGSPQAKAGGDKLVKNGGIEVRKGGKIRTRGKGKEVTARLTQQPIHQESGDKYLLGDASENGLPLSSGQPAHHVSPSSQYGQKTSVMQGKTGTATPIHSETQKVSARRHTSSSSLHSVRPSNSSILASSERQEARPPQTSNNGGKQHYESADDASTTSWQRPQTDSEQSGIATPLPHSDRPHPPSSIDRQVASVGTQASRKRSPTSPSESVSYTPVLQNQQERMNLDEAEASLAPGSVHTLVDSMQQLQPLSSSSHAVLDAGTPAVIGPSAERTKIPLVRTNASEARGPWHSTASKIQERNAVLNNFATRARHPTPAALANKQLLSKTPEHTGKIRSVPTEPHDVLSEEEYSLLALNNVSNIVNGSYSVKSNVQDGPHRVAEGQFLSSDPVARRPARADRTPVPTHPDTDNNYYNLSYSSAPTHKQYPRTSTQQYEHRSIDRTPIASKLLPVHKSADMSLPLFSNSRPPTGDFLELVVQSAPDARTKPESRVELTNHLTPPAIDPESKPISEDRLLEDVFYVKGL